MVRHNNQLPENLPQLQNLIKRDPESYKEEFLQQHQHYKSVLEVFRLTPNKFNKSLDDIVIFLAQVAHCYPRILESFPREIIDVLQTYNTVLDNEMRLTFCKALIQLRNKSLLEPTVLLSLFFQLLRCQDKNLRKFLETHIVADIRNVNAKHKNAKINATLQNFMFSMLKDSNVRAAKMSADIMVELYKKNIWNDAKTVNVLATGCFAKPTKVTVACLKFFQGADAAEQEGNEESDSDDELTVKEIAMANRVNKKSKKREKQLSKAKQLVAKSKKKAAKPPAFNFSALHLIHDPQDFAERLFKQLEKNNDRFEIKLIILDVVSRLIGLHNLFLLNFYPYLQRFLQPHQREVTKLLQFMAQASHELVPPDALEPVIKTLANNFVAERNSADVMAIGLNAIREICARCPLAMNADLLQDLARYKHYRERSVMAAARSLITLFRTSVPDMLHKKDRGRPTEASVALQVPKYGHQSSHHFVPGADILLDDKFDNDRELDEDAPPSSEDTEDEWVDVPCTSDEDDQDDKDDDAENESVELKVNATDRGKEDRRKRQRAKLTKIERKKRKVVKQQNARLEKVTATMTAEKREKATLVSNERILTDKDFIKIDAALAKQHITYPRQGSKRPYSNTNDLADFVKLTDIENIFKKRKHDKQDRIDSVKKGQEGREKFGYKDGRQNPLCSTTNREKRKGKAFQMLKHKIKGKAKRSFKEKQIALRNHLLKQKRMK